MNQRKGKMHKAALGDKVTVNLSDILSVLKVAQKELTSSGEDDAALRLEIFHDYLAEDYRGGRLAYTPKMFGL